MQSKPTGGAEAGNTPPLLRVRDLTIEIPTHSAPLRPVNNVSFDLGHAEILGVVGESGSGKSLTSLALTQLSPKRARISGSVVFEGEDLLRSDARRLRAVRGGRISYIFQDPQAALNPLMTCGSQVAEGIRQHLRVRPREAMRRTEELFAAVGLPDASRHLRKYPHQLSGGMRQRVVVAMALSCQPSLIVADEPTTALDVLIQAQILSLLRGIRSDRQASVIFISHDLGVVAELADRILVMYGGRIVESGSVDDIVNHPEHPYTQGLIRSVPSLLGERRARFEGIDGLPPHPGRLPPGCPFAPRCAFRIEGCETMPPLESARRDHKVACWVRPPFAPETTSAPPVSVKAAVLASADAAHDKPTVAPGPGRLLSVEDLRVRFPSEQGWFAPKRWLEAVAGVTLQIMPNETLGLVGESGCGKSTLARAIVGLVPPSGGRIEFAGHQVYPADAGWRPVRRAIQMVFQDPYSSLDPRMRASDLVAEALDIHGLVANERERTERVGSLLQRVGIDPVFRERFPHQFSGGQRQRIAIARALAAEPRLLVCDEPVTSLDVSIRAQVLNVLRALQDEFGLSLLFIAHDLSLVRHLAHRTAVMYLGKVVESGETENVINRPRHPYTLALRSAVPHLGGPGMGQALAGEIPSVAEPPSGCRFRSRCRFAQARCAEEEPALRVFDGRMVACHFAEEIANHAQNVPSAE